MILVTAWKEPVPITTLIVAAFREMSGNDRIAIRQARDNHPACANETAPLPEMAGVLVRDKHKSAAAGTFCSRPIPQAIGGCTLSHCTADPVGQLNPRSRRGSACLEASRRLQKRLILFPGSDCHAHAICRPPRSQRPHRYPFILQAVRIDGGIFSQIAKQKVRSRWNHAIS